jgi:outer membrane protein TolC
MLCSLKKRLTNTPASALYSIYVAIILLIAPHTAISHAPYKHHHKSIRTLTLRQVLESTLLLSPEILLENEQQTVVLGNFLTEFGLFDTIFNWDISALQDYNPLQAFNPLGLSQQTIPGTTSLNTDSGQFNIGLNKTYYNGINVGTSVNMTRQQTNMNKILDVPIENRSFINFTLNVPFLQGSAVGLAAKADYLNYLAERYTYAHTISQQALSSILAYWAYEESYQSFNVLAKAVAQDKQLVDVIKEMVKRGEQTQSDLTLAKANYEGRLALYYTFREQYFLNKQRLANLMGIKTEAINLLPPPSTNFAKMRNMEFTQGALVQFFKNMMIYRNDLKAALLTMKSNFTLLKVRRVNLDPQFNGNASVGYRGLYEGTETTRSLSENTKGPVASVGLTYSFPIENNTARGNLMSQSAVYAQSKINYNNLLRTIKISLITAYNSVKLFGYQTTYNKNAIGNYSETLNNEIIKLKLGEASLIDTLRIKDLLVQSQLDKIKAESGYSQALAQLYYEQGLFICHDHMHCRINLKPIS